MKSFKHKPGDTVTIKSLDWYNENKGQCGFVPIPSDEGDDSFVEEMSQYCGMKATIMKTITAGPADHFYELDCDNGEWAWYDCMFENTDETTTENS